ncbi:MAG: glycosyltransferase family 2 protein [Actinobacteria bacterium]|nr:glycosyltransferase family 2 protein [Actinomycetota bacterium]
MQKNFKEKLALIFISFWTIIIIVRSLIFENLRENKATQIIIKGIHIHHFFIGFVFILISAAIYYFTHGRKRFIPLLFFGIGLGLVFDEFFYWSKLQFDYWAIKNFFAIITLFGIFQLLLFIFNKKQKQAHIAVYQKPYENPENPLVTIVIPAFNEEKFVDKTLQSILIQDYKNFELIVVDNNSTDNTSKIAEDFGAKVIFEPSQGVGFARQKGFMEAKGKIIATTDADTILPSNWVSRIVEEFEKDKELVAFGGLYTLYSGAVTARIAVSYLTYPFWLLDKFFSHGWSLPGANLAIRKDAFLKIGGFKTELKLGEDANISQRLKTIGKVKLDPDFLVQTSGRRFKNGLFCGLLTYAPNGIIRMLFKKEKFVKLTPVRIEKSLFNKLAFIPLFLSVILLFSLFYLSNPSIAEAKYIRKVKNSIDISKNELKEESQKLQKFFPDIQKIKLKINNSKKLLEYEE